MESSVAPVPNRRSHLPNRTYRSLIHHLCSSFDREPRVSLATPAVLQELVLRTDIALVSPGETCVPGVTRSDEKLTENSPIVEPRSDGGSGEPKVEKVETISQEKSLILEDVFDGIDLQDASLGSRHKDFFDEFELMINGSEDFVPESCVNLFEALDVNDYDDDDGMAKQAIHLVQSIAEKPNIATELQVDSVESGDKKVSDFIGSKAEEARELAEPNDVMSCGVLENDNETLAREMESEKTVISSSQAVAASVSQMVEDDDVEEGEISGDDDDDNMLVGDDDDLPVERHEESHVSQEVLDQRGEGTSKSFCSSLVSGVEVFNVENGVKEKDQTSKNQEKMVSGTSIKKKSAPSKEAKARKKAKFRKKRAQERLSLGVKKLKLKPVAPKPKPIKYCRHYLKGRCLEGGNCKFSHDTTPETKSSPCCYFATQSCMKGDDCPYDHDLSKYPCKNFIAKGFCHRGDNCLFSHKGTPQPASDSPTSSFSPQKSTKQTVREAIARLPAIQARVSSSVAFLKPSSQSNQRNSSDSSFPKINEHVTPPQILPLRKPSVAPKGMSFLSVDKASQEEPKQNTHDSDNQSLKQSQQRSFLPIVPPKGISFLSSGAEELKALNQEPQEPTSTRILRIATNSHVQSSLNSAMKLAAEFESAKAERRSTNDPAEAVNRGDVTFNKSVTRNSGNISSKILEFLSSFSHGQN